MRLSLDCIVLNYKARLCYYGDDISSNSQAASEIQERVTTYGQLVHVFQNNAILQASSSYTVVFLSIDTM